MHLTKTTNAFAKYFTTLKDLDWTHPIALAVSGGGDSMALLATALDYRDSLNLSSSLLVLTVDHGIRSEAAREAEMVQTYCDKRCVHHEILTWSGSLPTSAVAENARNIRRRLLLDACLQRGFHQLALAHTMDDV
ncbi:MAG: ATP-binding protein, partial [Hyphomicrobiales bacterium]